MSGPRRRNLPSNHLPVWQRTIAASPIGQPPLVPGYVLACLKCGRGQWIVLKPDGHQAPHLECTFCGDSFCFDHGCTFGCGALPDPPAGDGDGASAG
jgi:hypothetical protein